MKFFFIFIVFFILFCGKTIEEDCIISYKNYCITKSQFKEDYFRYLQFSNKVDSDSLRVEFAKFMIYKFYIADSLQNIIPFDTIGNLFYRAKKIELSLQNYIEENFIEKIPVPDSSTVAKFYDFQNKEFLIEVYQSKHFFNVDDINLNKNIKYYKLEWVKPSILSSILQNILYNLKVGSYSKVVRDINGYYIIRVLNVRDNIIKKDYDFKVRYGKYLKRYIRFKSDYLLDKFVIDSLYGDSVYINSEAIDILRNIVFELLKKKEIGRDALGIDYLKNIDKFNNIVIAEVKDIKITVYDFLSHWYNIPVKIREHSLKKSINYVIRDQFLYYKYLHSDKKYESIKEDLLYLYKVNFYYNIFSKKNDRELALFLKSKDFNINYNVLKKINLNLYSDF